LELLSLALPLVFVFLVPGRDLLDLVVLDLDRHVLLFLLGG